MRMSAMRQLEGSVFWASTGAAGESRLYRKCNNQLQHGVCNWAVPAENEAPNLDKPDEPDEEAVLCVACELNSTIPDLSKPENIEAWRQLENAKRRLLYSLSRQRLGYCPKRKDPRGLAFAFLQDAEQKVVTGHADGVITINLAEADPAWREQTRQRLGESYRTLLGHFRHESGHYYWDRLLKDNPLLPEFRRLFGDETVDYGEALRAHYASPPGANRNVGFVSAYAQMHPFEDWAETWAHYLHMVDTLETARSYGLALESNPGEPIEVGALRLTDFEQLIQGWVPVTLALNSLNRSMGLPDPYPFTLDEGIIEKLRFVHDVIAAERARERPRNNTAKCDEPKTGETVSAAAE
jgi:hypothetical protein